MIKDASPVETRKWILSFKMYVEDGIKEEEKPSSELWKRQILNKADIHWFNKLKPQVVNANNSE